jgi:AmmeMemoRadiSam system protein A
MNNYTKLAKLAVEEYIKKGKIITPPSSMPSKFLSEKAGIFVTIEQDGNLRGCIGTYLPTRDNIAEEIIHNAVSAAIEDYRFSGINENELEQLSYTVYILDTLEKIKEKSMLDPKKYGILIKSDMGKSGLLLPDLEGLDTWEKQFEAVCNKCNIDPESENIEIFRFKATKY